ncbi:MAG: S46 family peptidase [Chitinophagaceae bacterium]|nr:S46 family peptidase [Chitinophagaceae bacterium]
MKKLLLSIFCLSISLQNFADKGMWIPSLISQNMAEMKRLGIELNAQDIYDVNKSSLKDAIVHFGGGCTGEMISKDGLLMTNHHCGYGNIASLSTVENNYLQNGFVATSREMELPAPGLSVKFLVRIEDVTEQVLAKLGNAYGDDVSTRVSEISKVLTDAANESGKYESNVREYWAGNKYYLLVYQKFTDVRLVATPPESLGKFGGDTDNWMWPRHTCDFSMFRVYSNNLNQPAPYSINNRPYQPRHHLPVSLKGVQDGDFAMVMGYPGRTSRYLTSYGIDMALTEFNPTIVKIRDKRLAIMRDAMDIDPKVDLDYSSTYASVANYWKYYIGQSEQLKKLGIENQKKNEEDAFERWARDNDRQLLKLMPDYADAYAEYKPYVKHGLFIREGIGSSTLSQMAMAIASLKTMVDKKEDKEKIEAMLKRLQSALPGMKETMSMSMDKNLFEAMNAMFYSDVPRAQHPSIFNEIFRKFGNEDLQKTFKQYTDYVYTNTALFSDEKMKKLLTYDNLQQLFEDPAVAHAINIGENFEQNYAQKRKDFQAEMFELDRAYQNALLEKNKKELMSPDANSTMRLSYGSVQSYAPQDAVSFKFYTTASGLLEKYKAGDKEFDLQPKIVDLLKRKDYGDYADANGNLVTCFITNNDITGGNSGSPVINAKGEYIGSAFDGNWEAMSGDIAFDERFKRTIVVDARYIMWVLDKVLGGRMLLEEMDIKN